MKGGIPRNSCLAQWSKACRKEWCITLFMLNSRSICESKMAVITEAQLRNIGVVHALNYADW